jgi:predicted hydrocarbon binding protein
MDAKPSMSDYFADDGYIRTDLATGLTRDRAGTRLIGLPDELLAALHETLDAECGPTAERILQAAGKDWGRGLAERFTTELADHRGEPLAATSVARFQADLQSAFRQLGWGVLTLDFQRYDVGILVAEVRHAPAGGPADALLAGTLAGLLSQIAGRELAAATTPTTGELKRFVIALPERLEQIADVLHRRRPHEEVVAALQGVRA